MISEFGMSSVGIVTDLAPKDVERLERLDPIGEDDVLNFHLFLREGKIFEKNIKRYSNLDIRK
jgi:hypothetical protein